MMHEVAFDDISMETTKGGDGSTTRGLGQRPVPRPGKRSDSPSGQDLGTSRIPPRIESVQKSLDQVGRETRSSTPVDKEEA